MCQSPKFSIITVTRNNAVGLRNTLKSIRIQNTTDYEIIVIDGNSTDATEAVIEEFRDLINIFEPDEGKGIYPAMNQGVAISSGEWVIFMNSGDTFSHSKALELFDAPEDSDIAFGKAKKPNGSAHLEFTGLEAMWKRMPFSHQAAFCRRKLLVSRPFDIRFTIVADFEFFLWAYSNHYKFYQMKLEIAEIELDGVSETALVKRVWQTYLAARKHFHGLEVHRFYFKKLKWAFRKQYTKGVT